MPKLLVPDNLEWDLTGLPVEVARVPRGRVPSEHEDAEGLIAWGISRAALAESVPHLPRLRWVQTLSAGVDHLTGLDLPGSVTICNGKGLHDAPVAEHTVALLLAGVRGLHRLRDAQREGRWGQGDYWARSRAESSGERSELRTLEDARVLVLGMGAIGVAIARALQPLGARVEGVAQAAGEREGFTVHALGALDSLLPATDVLVMVLPDTPATRGILSRERIARLPRHAWVVNVGRGNAIDEEALADAIEARSLGGAALDVFTREPLEPESRLWQLPDVIVSPHVAGGEAAGSRYSTP
ncbi:MAG TPA: NAD(P)-dependent oxidoreductase [Deinococcales bacterium]|nr:NAD(P)-dependent oxidoreductase [Deinococcales bacterium]